MNISIRAVFAQIINFGILFFLFNKFLSKPISKAIEDRRSLIKKLEKTDAVCETKIQEAEEEAKKIIEDGNKRKEAIIVEAGMLANKRKNEILEEAKNKSQEIINESKERAKHLEDELANSFADGVKRTSLLVVKKLFKSSKDLQQEYLDEVVSEIIK